MTAHQFTRARWAWAAGLLLACAAARADDGICQETVGKGVDDQLAAWQVSDDNDVFAKRNKDRWYTNGFKYTQTYKDGCRNGRLTRALYNAGKTLQWQEESQAMSYALGQAMYTPDDIVKREFQPHERPYAAFLYVAAAAHAFKGNEYRSTELKVGTTGRYAAGYEVQRAVHWVVNSERPRGWANQLGARPGVQLSHARTYSARLGLADDLLAVQAGWQAALGSLRDYGGVSGALILGDVKGRQTPVQIGNEGDFSDLDANSSGLLRHVYGFVAASASGVAYNYFLQGRPAGGETDIHLRRFYFTTQWGVSIPWAAASRLVGGSSNSTTRVVYSASLRTPEFDGHELNAAEKRQRWGTVSLVVDL